jgi:hypothetical protein
LVGGDHDPEPKVIEARDRLKAAGNRNPLLRRLYIVVGILVDHTIAVQNDEVH